MQAITEIASPQLRISDTSNYTLSIRLMPGGFCFIIYQPSRMSVLGLFDYATASAEETNGSYQQNPWLQQHYAKINCAVNTNRWTLIPSDFMIDGKEEDLWHLNFGEGQHGQLQSHAIKALNCINLYEAEPLSTEFCRTTKAKEVPIQTPLLHKALILSKRTADKQLCIAQRGEFMDFALADNGQMLAANTCLSRNSEELAFYTLNIFNHFGLNQNNQLVTVSGDTTPAGINLLGQYIRHLQTDTLPTQCNYPKEMQKMKEQQKYTDLIYLALCE
jgi:hypothetical protein